MMAVSLLGRIAFAEEDLRTLIAPTATQAKQLQAYNLCDGTRTQADIVRALKLDHGNFSRTAARWIAAGVLYKIGSGREAKLLHVYPLPEAAKKAES